jgi:HPt (histidine-containing phosphotransfer) domain-containing protein/two-component sensor histidine kinase
MSLSVKSKVFVTYAALQAAVISTYFFIPTDSWAQLLIQMAVGWGGAGVVLVGVRKHRPPGPLIFILFAAGLFLNAGGILVAGLYTRILHLTPNAPALPDAFYLAIFPGLVAGMAMLIRRRSVERESAALIDTTIITTGLALLSWVYIIRPQVQPQDVRLLQLIVVLAYPVGDLVVLAMLLRFVLGGGRRNRSFCLLLFAMLTFLGADIGWATVGQIGHDPGPIAQHLLEMTSMAAFALTGAAALDPSVVELSQPGAQRDAQLGRGLMTGLLVASLIAPAILLIQTLRGAIVDGIAIAVSSAVLFLLVVARMAQLFRRLHQHTRALAERDRAVRLVLGTVNEGLLRLSPEGLLAEERSATIDRWFGSYSGGVSFADFMLGIDPSFALAFRLGHEALREDLLPLELNLAQLPSRLRAHERTYQVSYLPVTADGQPDGLLVVIDDVTEQEQLARQDAEMRELVALLQAFTRDRTSTLAAFDEAAALAARLSPGAGNPIEQGRALHTLKGNAALLSLDVVAGLCHAAEDYLEAGESERTAGALAAVQERWAALEQSFRAVTGERARSVVELPPEEIERLAEEIGRGLAPAAIVRRISGWRCEPVERAFERLATSARSLARRLGKGDIAVEVEGNGLGLDPRRWEPLWAELVHVVRNAVDHGIEAAAERQAAGKSEQARLRFSASLQQRELVIELADDGRGIDWAAVRAAAAARGLPAGSEPELMAALLSPGLTTSVEVSATSGRGLGMTAVSARVRELQGELTVETRRGAGTCWKLSFPRSTLRHYEGAQDEVIEPIEDLRTATARSGRA